MKTYEIITTTTPRSGQSTFLTKGKNKIEALRRLINHSGDFKMFINSGQLNIKIKEMKD